jgi:hypothetical protein
LGENPSWASVEDAKDELLILLMMTLDWSAASLMQMLPW